MESGRKQGTENALQTWKMNTREAKATDKYLKTKGKQDLVVDQ